MDLSAIELVKRFLSLAPQARLDDILERTDCRSVDDVATNALALAHLRAELQQLTNPPPPPNTAAANAALLRQNAGYEARRRNQ